jgi:ribonuclease BN (tRNA processing enzyme)
VHDIDVPDVRLLGRIHADVTQAGRIAADSGVKHLVLSHTIPVDLAGGRFPAEDDEGRLAPIRTDYDGAITIGSDLLRLGVSHSLPAEEATHRSGPS